VDTKPLFFLGSSRDDIRAFPKKARQIVGHELFQIQQGLEPSNWKPARTVGPGVRELRVQVRGAYRVLYVAKFAEGIYVLHAFEKQTQRTRPTDIALARKRLSDLERARKKAR
jgi:phage-related protein